MHHRKFGWMVALAAAGFGCAGKPVDIGENESQTGEQLSDYAAAWDGYAEAYNFASGSDRVRLTLDKQGHGTLEFGEDVDYGPPDPDSGYANPPYFQLGLPLRSIREGFTFTVQAASVQAGRLQIGIDPFEIQAEWCALQTAFLETAPPASAAHPIVPLPMNPPGSYVCNQGTIDPDAERAALVSGPANGTGCMLDDPDGNQTPVECYKMAACGYVGAPCTCTADGCSFVPEMTNFENRLDGALDNGGKTFNGTLGFVDPVYGDDRITIHLERH